MLWLFISLLFAQEPSATMVVEASRDIEFYVSPIKIKDYTSENIQIETAIDTDSAFTYLGAYIQNIKVSTGRGGYEPVTLSHPRPKVYNERTVTYVWENCNYKRDPLKCTVQNGQYFLETIVTVDDNQLVVKATLYDPDAQVLLSSSRTDDKIVRWIKQQELTVRQEQQSGGLLGGNGQATTIHKPKEELPLKWEIPHTLTNRMVQQLILGTSVSIKLELH